MDKSHHLSTPMSYQSLDVKNDHSCPQEEDEEIIGLEVPYLSVIDTLMYLTNCTRTYRSNPQLVGNTDTCYLSDLYKSRSQIEYLFTCDNCYFMDIYQAKKDVSIHQTNASHIKVFYTYKLQKSGNIDVKQI